MKIFIGIPVYNRKEKLQALAESLKEVNGIETCKIGIFDDCSDEFDEHFLQRLFPAAFIKRNQANIGADKNTFLIHKTFLEEDYDLLFLCDSDLIVHPDCLSVIRAYMPKTDGILSVLNSNHHKTIETVESDLLIKNSIGAAGLVLNKKLVSDLVSSVKPKYTLMWDWYVCMHMKEKNKNIFVTKRSYVFHTGIEGENSNVLLFDYALGYCPGGITDREIYHHLHEHFVSMYMATPDYKKLLTLIRKMAREGLRRVFAMVFGERRLLDFLVWRKMRRKGCNNEKTLL